MADAPIGQTWDERDLPLLQAIARAEEEEYVSHRPLNSVDPWLRDASRLDERNFQLGLQALHDARLHRR